MAYQTTKPAPNDNLDVSVTDIQGNFSTANTVIGINHYPFDDLTANVGKHKFVDMPKLASVPTIASGDGGLYTKTAGETNIFYTPDASGKEFQITRTISTATEQARFGTFTAMPGPPAGQTPNYGWTFLPGGLLFQYGTLTGTIGTTGLITFPVPFTTGFYSLTISVQRNTPTDSRVSISTAIPPTATAFTYVITTTGATSLYWMAIGK
jgi:hypothetical protein